MKRNFTNYFAVILFAVLSVFALSCKKEQGDVEQLLKPELAKTIPNEGKDTTTLGKTLDLHPSIAVKKGLTYSWTVNNIVAGTDSVYAFTPSSHGDYSIKFKASNAAGELSVDYQIHVYGKYENGFFIANEGWFGTEPSSVNFYRYDTQTLEEDIYKKENPDKNIGSGGSNLQFATVYKDRLYLVNKVGGPITVTDAYSLKEVGRTVNGQWLAFTGIDDTRGLVTATDGIYPINIQTFAIGTKITGVSGSGGDIFKAGNYVFAIVGTEAVILNIADYTVAKRIAKVRIGFAQTPDGNVWAATSDGYVLKINPQTLEVESTLASYSIPSNSPWRSTSIVASGKENSIFIRSGRNIYKYPHSLYDPFYTIASDRMFYWTIGFDKKKNQIIATTIKGYGQDSKFNDLLFINGTTGNLDKKLSYEHIYFPAMPVFQP